MKSTTVNTAEVIGDWITGPTDTEWGSCIVEITLSLDGNLKWEVRPTSGGQPIVENGKSSLHKGNLVSDMLNGGKPLGISVEGETLLLERPGEGVYRFKRKARP